MSILQPKNNSFRLHYDDIINLIAHDIHAKPSDMKTTVITKCSATNYFSSEREDFHHMEVNVQTNSGTSLYTISEQELKKLIAASFKLDEKNLMTDLNLQYDPSLGEQINSINCTINTLDKEFFMQPINESLSKIKSLRNKFIDSHVVGSKNCF